MKEDKQCVIGSVRENKLLDEFNKLLNLNLNLKKKDLAHKRASVTTKRLKYNELLAMVLVLKTGQRMDFEQSEKLPDQRDKGSVKSKGDEFEDKSEEEFYLFSKEFDRDFEAVNSVWVTRSDRKDDEELKNGGSNKDGRSTKDSLEEGMDGLDLHPTNSPPGAQHLASENLKQVIPEDSQEASNNLEERKGQMEESSFRLPIMRMANDGWNVGVRGNISFKGLWRTWRRAPLRMGVMEETQQQETEQGSGS
ncbi:hypothetical protein BY996DRAFT_6601035 [Phakopsora pachyrhizi]|nr:hypothetical protein BY996DRAFT_6601035 [Phakopsora pachyrhizi]